MVHVGTLPSRNSHGNYSYNQCGKRTVPVNSPFFKTHDPDKRLSSLILLEYTKTYLGMHGRVEASLDVLQNFFCIA